MTDIEFLEFSMRKEAPKPGADWFRIVVDKKGDGPAKVYIYDEIGFWGTTAKDFAAQLNDIDAKEIHLHLNSPGGSVFDGLAIGAALKEHPAKVIAKVDGMAASAASFILQYADEREISRNAQVMIHDATAYAGGNAAQMRKAADLLDRVSDNIADIYAVRSGQGTVQSWRKIMKSGDTWYSGNEALDAGLVDSVTDNPEEDAPEEATSNSWSKEEVEAFLVLPAAKLAEDASRSIITNRVEEALMTGEDPKNTQTTPPPAPQPPAPQASAPAPAQPALVQQPAPAQAAVAPLLVNGAEVTDMAAVQAHIVALETFKTETIEDNRKKFVKQLANEGKVLAGEDNLKATEEFALSLSAAQFDSWKATMSATQPSTLFQQHGVTPADAKAPANGSKPDEVANRIIVLEEIVQTHRDSGATQEEIENKSSYKELQQLKSQKAGA